MRAPTTIRITLNLERNLDRICTFLEELSTPTTAFARLIDELFDVVIPNLERFPAMGRDILSRQPLSAQGLERHDRIRARMGPDVALREYIFGDYILLYGQRGADLYLLAIRHHRQLAYNLVECWL